MKNKTVWITGASSGIGEALAYELDKEGVNIILSARSVNKLNEIQKKLKSKTHVLPIDVSDHESISLKTKEAIAIYGTIDILINNAGISQRGFIEDNNLAIDKRLFDVNFFGNIGLTRALLPHLLERQTGNIVVISSIAGKLSTPGRSAYAATKHALLGWYDALRAEVKDRNIQVNVICPGYVKTNVSINALDSEGEATNKMDDNQLNGMSSKQCAAEIIQAIKKNKAEVLIGGKEVFGTYLRKFFPGLYRKIIADMAIKQSLMLRGK